MTDLDRMLKEAAEAPTDHTLRGAAADALRENGEDELADVVEDGETGPALLSRVKQLSLRVGMPVSVKTLWCQFFVMDRFVPHSIDRLPAGWVGDAAEAERHEELQRQIDHFRRQRRENADAWFPNWEWDPNNPTWTWNT